MLSGFSSLLNRLRNAFCCRSKNQIKKTNVASSAPSSNSMKNRSGNRKFDKKLFWRQTHAQQRTTVRRRPPSNSGSLKKAMAVMLATASTAAADCYNQPMFFRTPSGVYALTVKFYSRACDWATNALLNSACNITRLTGTFPINETIDEYCYGDDDPPPPGPILTNILRNTGNTIIFSTANNTAANITRSVQCVIDSITNQCAPDFASKVAIYMLIGGAGIGALACAGYTIYCVTCAVKKGTELTISGVQAIHYNMRATNVLNEMQDNFIKTKELSGIVKIIMDYAATLDSDNNNSNEIKLEINDQSQPLLNKQTQVDDEEEEIENVIGNALQPRRVSL